MKGTALQPLLLVPGQKPWSSWDHLPVCTRTCPQGWLLLQECPGWLCEFVHRADVTVEFSRLFGQKVPLSSLSQQLELCWRCPAAG